MYIDLRYNLACGYHSNEVPVSSGGLGRLTPTATLNHIMPNARRYKIHGDYQPFVAVDSAVASLLLLRVSHDRMESHSACNVLAST